MRVEINYGKGKLPVELPEGLDVTVIARREMATLADAPRAIEAALSEPVGAPPLEELARGAQSACILICDITRPVPNGLFLGILIRRLIAAGMPADAITVLVATGLHRPNEGDELAELVGDPWVLDQVRVENHFATDDSAHVDLGRTSGWGTVVRLDRRLVEADLKIATGLVEPHFMAGYSGGRKVIAPGVAHAETITTFHAARFMEHARAANCVLDGNPLHEEQLEIIAMLGGALALNTVITEDRELCFVNFGEIVESHLLAVAHAREHAEVEVAERFPTILTGAAGYPLDKTYYQTVKAMVAPMDILSPGGDLIIASECAEGMGSAPYVEAQRRLVAGGPERFLEEIEAKAHADIDEWQTEMQLKPMRIGTIHLYSDGLEGEERELTGVAMTEDLSATIAAAIQRAGCNRLAVIPEGPYVVPRIAE